MPARKKESLLDVRDKKVAVEYNPVLEREGRLRKELKLEGALSFETRAKAEK